jgi:hypothetical protein
MHAAGGTRARLDLEVVGPEAGDRLPDGVGRPLPELDQDDDGHAEDDPETGQHRAHQVAPQHV